MIVLVSAIRTIAHGRFAQDRSRSVSAFSGFIGENFDTNVKVDQCVQHVDNIGTEVNYATDPTCNKWTVFECLRKAGWIKIGKRLVSLRSLTSQIPSKHHLIGKIYTHRLRKKTKHFPSE